MNSTMSAIFDSADAAELALKRVRERGVPVSRFTLGPAGPHAPDPRSPVSTSVLLPGMDGWSGGNVSPVGVPRGWNTGFEGPPSGDQLLRLELDQRDAATARSMLISCHGRFVR